MKKISILLLFIVAVLSGCSDTNVNNDYVLIDSGDNYKLYAYDDNDILSDYVYLVFNNEGTKIDSGYYESAPIDFHRFDNNVLKISVGAGTNVSLDKYYDLTNSRMEEYETVYYDDGELVVYFEREDDATNICVKKLFDKDLLLHEELDMGGIMAFDYDVSVENETVTVKHPKGENYEMITETFELKNI